LHYSLLHVPINWASLRSLKARFSFPIFPMASASASVVGIRCWVQGGAQCSVSVILIYISETRITNHLEQSYLYHVLRMRTYYTTLLPPSLLHTL
jgi:hypothetical protein